MQQIADHMWISDCGEWTIIARAEGKPQLYCDEDKIEPTVSDYFHVDIPDKVAGKFAELGGEVDL